MPPPYCYEYPRPAVTVDLVVFTLTNDGVRALFIRRKNDPFAGRWAIPGGFVEMDEPIETAARRELREETGCETTGPVSLIGVFGDPGRDPRGRTISLAHAAVLRAPAPEVSGGDDAETAAWLDPAKSLELAFDHDAIVARALEWLKQGVREGRLTLAILPGEFGDDDVKRLYRGLGLTPRGAIGWRARMSREARIAAVPGSPSRYRMVEE